MKKPTPKSTPVAEYCGNCKFFYEKSGQCRRYPGMVFVEGDDYFVIQPLKDPSDWCGEHRMKGPVQ